MRERMKVGAAQIAPCFLDKRGTIAKIGRTLEEASRLGLDLLVFPETFLSAYPFWRGAVSVRQETELTVRMQREAVRIPSEETAELAELVRGAGVTAVIGLNDVVGHYARRDLFRLSVRDAGSDPSLPVEPPPARLREAADRWEVCLHRLEQLVDAMLRTLDRAAPG